MVNAKFVFCMSIFSSGVGHCFPTSCSCERTTGLSLYANRLAEGVPPCVEHVQQHGQDCGGSQDGGAAETGGQHRSHEGKGVLVPGSQEVGPNIRCSVNLKLLKQGGAVV